jgi:hypothetical protein
MEILIVYHVHSLLSLHDVVVREPLQFVMAFVNR